MMMGVGILVLLLLIIGIGSALKAPSTTSSDQTASGEKSIDLAGNATDQANGVQPAPGTTSAENTQQDVSLPPISSTPTQGQTPVATDGQQRVEVQGDLNNALTQPQNQQQLNNVAVNSTLPTEPATVAPVRNGNASRDTGAKTQTAERPATTRPARQQAVIEPKKPQATVKTEPKPVAQTPSVLNQLLLWRARRHRLRLLRQHQKRRRLRLQYRRHPRRKPRQHQPLEGRPQVMWVR